MASAQTASLPPTVAFFHAMCLQIQSENSLSLKSDMIQQCVRRFSGDLVLLFKLLLPKYVGRIYHLKDKQLIKLLSSLLGVAEGTLKDHSDKTGCIATSAAHFFKPVKAVSTMTLAELEASLAALAAVTMEDQQRGVLAKFLPNATKADLFVFLREVKLDLRLGAGIRIVLAGLHASANDLYKQSANIPDVVRKVLAGETDIAAPLDGDDDGADGSGRSVSPSRVKGGHIVASITLGVPVSPMLAAPSRGAAAVIAKCPNGCFSETKYDGERIQIHKQGSKFSFFARSTKEMKADKYEGLEEHIMAAVKATDCILDGEILLVDRRTSQPLPFGTLGKHKKAQFDAANTAVFLFDILYLDGESLLNVPLDQRRDRLRRSVTLIPNRIFYSDLRIVQGSKDEQIALLTKHLNYAIATGLEGLVVKDMKGTYEPGSRHWLKLKKDYLDGCGDTADLVMLGAWYGTGAKGGKLSTFLMGVLDKSMRPDAPGRFKTVTSVANGLDDEKLDAWQPIFHRDMVKTNGVAPVWLAAHSSNVPDMVFKDPNTAPVFEMLCNEYTVSKVHTAANISMRFGRIIRHRDDKDPSTATNLDELKKLVAVAKEHAPVADDDAPNKEAPLLRGQSGHAHAAAAPAHSHPSPVTARVPATAAPAPTGPALLQPKLAFPVAVQVSRQPQPRSSPPATASETTAAYAAAPAPGSLLRTVSHDVAQPISVPGLAQSNFLIVHCVALRGKWSNRGVMGSITTTHGDECKEAYDAASSQVTLGDLVVVEVSNRLSSGKMYIANLIAQVPPTAAGAPPQVDMDAFIRGLTKAANFALKHECSIHLARPDKSTGVQWPAVEALIASKIMPLGLHTTVYLREGGLGGRTSTMLEVASPPARAPPPSAVRPAVSHPPSQVAPPAAMEAPRRPAQAAAPAATLPASFTSLSSGDADFMSAVKMVVVTGDPDAGFLTTRQAEAVRQKALMMGAISSITVGSTTEPPPSTSHIITDGGTPAKVPYGAFLLPRAWVDACFAENRLLDPRRYLIAPVLEAPPPPALSLARQSSSSLQQQGSLSGIFTLFAGCRLVLSPRLDPDTAAAIANQVRMMGGEIQASWSVVGPTPSTHFITTDAQCPQAKKLLAMGATVVSPKWVTDSFDNGLQRPTHRYMIDESAAVGASPTANPTSPVRTAVAAATPQTAQHPVPAAPAAPPRSQAPTTTTTARAKTPDFARTGREIDAITTELRTFSVTFRAGESVRQEFAKVSFAAVGYSPSVTGAIEAALICLGAQRSPNPANATVVIADTMTELTVSRMASSHGSHSTEHAAWTVRLSWVVECVRNRRRMPYHSFLYGLAPKHAAAFPAAEPIVSSEPVVLNAGSAPSSIGKTFVNHGAAPSDLSPVKAKSTHYLSPSPQRAAAAAGVQSPPTGGIKALMLPSTLDAVSDDETPPPATRRPQGASQQRAASVHSDSTMSYDFNDVDSDDDAPPPPKRRQPLPATVLVPTDSDDLSA